jgi:predicted ribosomally synthesized peptide with SipW-like signal peptide
MKNTKDNKKDKKVLIGALGIASVIAAGSTFAWFTSSDEVTNRLTAAADYGVSITETFTPPRNGSPDRRSTRTFPLLTQETSTLT